VERASSGSSASSSSASSSAPSASSSFSSSSSSPSPSSPSLGRQQQQHQQQRRRNNGTAGFRRNKNSNNNNQNSPLRREWQRLAAELPPLPFSFSVSSPPSLDSGPGDGDELPALPASHYLPPRWAGEARRLAIRAAVAGDGETAGLALESLAERLELLGRETRREKGRPPPGTLPRGAASRVAACLAMSCPAPGDAARALRALPLAGGVHWVELVKGAARRGSAAGVRAALAAALSDPRIAQAEDYESDWQREARAAREEGEEEEEEEGGRPQRRGKSSRRRRRSPLDDASVASAAVRVAAVVAFGELGRAAAAERAYGDAIAAGAWDEAGRRRRRGGGDRGGDGNDNSGDEGAVVSLSPLNALLNALLVARARPRAAAAAARARQAGAAFDLVTYNTLLKGCMRSADAAGAEQLLADLRAAGLRGDEYTWNTAVKCFAYAGDLGRALRVLEDIGGGGSEGGRGRAPPASPAAEVPRAVWGSLLVACGRAGAPAAASRLWAEMQAAGVDPGLDGCHARLHACAYALDWEGAWGLLGEMRGGAVRPPTSSSAAAAPPAPPSPPLSGSSGGRSSSVRKRRPLPEPTTLSYNLALRAARPPPGRNPAGKRGSADAQPLARGEAVLAAMHKDGVAPDAATFTSLMELAASVGDGARAASLFAEMESAGGVRPDARACGALYAACGCDSSRPELADVALTVFRKTIWGPRRSRPGPAQFRALVLALLDHGRAEDAAAVAAGAAAACGKAGAGASSAGASSAAPRSPAAGEGEARAKGGNRQRQQQQPEATQGGGGGGISNVLSPKEVARLTAAVVEAAAAGGGGDGGGGGVSSALSKLLLPALGVSPGAEQQTSLSSSYERGDEEEGGAAPSSPLPPSPAAAASRQEPAVLDVSSLRRSPTEARAAVLCALADLASAGRAPRGGLKVVVSSPLLRPTIERLLRDELRLLEKEEVGREGREASSSSASVALSRTEGGDDSSPVFVSEAALTMWLERRGVARKNKAE